MDILVIGHKGQLGWELMRLLGESGLSATGLDLPELDITDFKAVEKAVGETQCKVLINAAAFTQVDGAESKQEAAFAVNRDASAHLARACKKSGAALVHVSTDFVFDGKKTSPYLEDDPICPISVYGKSKAEGEREIQNILDRHVIVRTAWLYGVHGQNFVKTMIRLAKEREIIKVVADQQGSPTAAENLAEALISVAKKILKEKTGPWGVFHYTGAGITTWHGFAQEAIELARLHDKLAVKQILPIPTSQYPTPATRPAYSVLDCSKIKQAFDVSTVPWRQALARTISRIYDQPAG